MYTILSALPELPSTSDNTAALSECSRFIMKAIKWAHKQAAHEGVRKMHDLFANWVWKSYGWQQFNKASLHYSRGSDELAFAETVKACSSLAKPEETDLFYARAVLQTLACAHRNTIQQQASHARAVLEALQGSSTCPDTPLMHYVKLLLEALAHDSHQLFQLLRVKYSNSLSRDPAFDAYITKIEQVFFQVSPSGGNGGLLGSLLKGLLEGDSENEDD